VSPLVELEAKLTGNVEFAADDLLTLSIHYDGRTTWLHDAATDTAVAKPYRTLMEPLPGVSVVGELGFLRDLAHEFLLREEDEETVADRRSRVIGLKPKNAHVAQLLKSTSFPIRKATIAFDAESHFPLRIRVFPASGTSLHALVGSGNHVEVSYHDVLQEPAEELAAFAPPEGARVFREETLPVTELIEQAPFSIPLEPYQAEEFSATARGILTLEDAGDRAHGTLLLEGQPAEDGSEPPLLTLRFGNYLARDMARRNATLSELGEELEIAGETARLLNRRPLWEEAVPGVDPDKAPLEISWQQEGVYWFAIAHGVDEESLRRMVSGHMRREPIEDAGSPDEDAAA